MATPRSAAKRAQAWVELTSEDPEALSALGVARAHVPAARGLERLRRLRLIELAGSLPARTALAALLHRSIQFYNPHKERCSLRLKPGDEAPIEPGDVAVLVWERGGERRPAAERWWLHEAGRRIEVREGVVWVMRFGGAAGDEAAARELVSVRDRRHGLLCNPHSQEARLELGEIPLPWITPERGVEPAGGEA